VPEKLDEPIRWKRPRRIFVNSMSDLFQEGVDTAFVRRVFDTMNLADWHTYQVLTKRADRMLAVTREMPTDIVHRCRSEVDPLGRWGGSSAVVVRRGSERSMT
jgi:protein gp37